MILLQGGVQSGAMENDCQWCGWEKGGGWRRWLRKVLVSLRKHWMRRKPGKPGERNGQTQGTARAEGKEISRTMDHIR